MTPSQHDDSNSGSVMQKYGMKTGIYVLPSILTAGNLALGFFAMTAAIKEQWATAAWCTLASIVLDILDGRIARLTNSCSKFGVEFDSFADLTSFCVAPALMVYLFVLKDYGRIGFAIALLYVLCGAMRLARFNTKAQETTDEAPTPYFLGLPTPAAGGILASFMIIYDIWAEGRRARTIKLLMKQVPALYHLLPAIVFVLAILMVSQLRYSTFKRVNLLRPSSLRSFLITIIICLMIYIYPQSTLFILFAGYACSGILEYFWRLYRLRHPAKQFQIETPDGMSWQVKKTG